MTKYVVTWEVAGLVCSRDHFVAVYETREEAEAQVASLRQMPELYSDVKIKESKEFKL